MATKEGKKTGGRVKGTPNKTTKELKDLIRGALDKVGGLDYLAKQADENPVAFMSLLGRILPAEIKAQVDADIKGLPTHIVITRPKQDGNK